MVVIILLCLVVIGFLWYKLSQKQALDKSKLEQYTKQIESAEQDLRDLSEEVDEAWRQLKDAHDKTDYEHYKLEECRKDLQAALDVYQDMTDKRLKEIDASMEEQRQKRQNELDKTFNETKERYDLMLQETQRNCEQQSEAMKQTVTDEYNEAMRQINEYKELIEQQREKFNSIYQTMVAQEKERQAQLYYTIQLPEEYRDDIDYLLTSVRPLIRHPDILSKLVWSNYIRPYLDDLCKRADIREEPGIYKITSLNTNKAYIGKSANVKKRIQDHMKAVVGVESIADQAVHHAILKEGFWNWTIEVIAYCDKERLNELEKYYIDFFKTQDYGYNKNQGGGG